MRRCAGCGGVLGQDCWNESDCVWISQDMQRRGQEALYREAQQAHNPCEGCSLITTEGGVVGCIGLCVGLTCDEDVGARRAAFLAIPRIFAREPA